MTINAPAALLLLLYQLVAEEQGVDPPKLTGTIQNDVLKEYIARGHLHLPAGALAALHHRHLRVLPTELPRWNTISISGYHMAEAGRDAVQEIAFTLADGSSTSAPAVDAGAVGRRLRAPAGVLLRARTTLLEEVAKFRAARRIWAQVMREEFGAKNPKSLMLRFHTQTAGVQLTAQQPEVNLVRVAVQGLAACLGGTQSLHTNILRRGDRAAHGEGGRLALRTQQVIAFESDVTKTVDPFAGSYAVESLTDELEGSARDLMAKVEDLGGAVAAIERGFQKGEIERSAYRVALDIDHGRRTVVGVNRFSVDEEEDYEPLQVDPNIEADQAKRLESLRAERDSDAVDKHLGDLRSAARGEDNVLYPMKEALRAKATVGEVSDALREVWGVYAPPDAF
jgi:methylmalonyl-CoA mutase N-terminal domain/subunit